MAGEIEARLTALDLVLPEVALPVADYVSFLHLDGQLFVDEYNSRFVTGADVGALRPRRSPAKRTGRGLETNVILFALTAIAVMTAL